MVAYCEAADLLLGDMPANQARGEQYVQAAADEINMRLASLYVLPPDDGADPSALLILKRANMLIATGRLVMAQAIGGEDTSTQAYGTYLLREGQGILDAITTGDLPLVGIDPREEYRATGNAPSVIFEDSKSAVDQFYGFVMRGEYNNMFRPGT